MERYQHAPGEAFRRLPEVYQVELTNACNLKCPMCLRTTDMVRPDQLLDLRLLDLMRGRGDFGGTAYVELQMAGEPTLHPGLEAAIRFLKEDVGVMVGLSTHGLLMRRKQLAPTLALLDALTVSVDSFDPETYHRLRFPGTLDQLKDNVGYLMEAWEPLPRPPFTELQLIDTPLNATHASDVARVDAWIRERGWDGRLAVRTTADCFAEMQGRDAAGSLPRNSELCLNPWTSVSVTQAGDVVSCCFIFDPDRGQTNWLGNLWDESLSAIWTGPRAAAMREMQVQAATGAAPLRDACAKCYLKSPVLIHQNIVGRLVRRR